MLALQEEGPPIRAQEPGRRNQGAGHGLGVQGAKVQQAGCGLGDKGGGCKVRGGGMLAGPQNLLTFLPISDFFSGAPTQKANS